MPNRINRAIELLEQDQPVYYVGAHSGHVLTRHQGAADAKTWADYINVGMEHGSFNMAGLDEYLQGLIDGGPTNSGHRTPAIIVEPPVDGSSEQAVRYNAWQFRQILGRGVHGILLCQAETPDAVRAFVESCRYPTSTIGEGHGLGAGTRGVGSEPSASCVWGIERAEYIRRADPWPLNPQGELLLGIKIESAGGVQGIEQMLSVPGIGFAEMGPGDLHMSYRIEWEPGPYTHPKIIEARNRVKSACEANGVRFLEGLTVDTIRQGIDDGVRVVSGQSLDAANIGRAYTKRTMPV